MNSMSLRVAPHPFQNASNAEINPEQADAYSGLSVPLNRKLNWLEADATGIYFNTAYGRRIRLHDPKDSEYDKLSHLNFENDFSSPENSFILTFKNATCYLTIQPGVNGVFTLKFNP